ncbi:MAG: ATP synthase F0 subunit A [Planctomycetes bacterium GWF2_42_9]|nr:MAG: ATP synthase F0 subunit A [Planctomycetes bacterium GWF2_42_9]HAL44804.1 ATP synthase F0 subunit A [Phycisphaerales bacterium]
MDLLFKNFVLAEFNPLNPIVPHKVFEFTVGNYIIPVSNHMIMIAFASLLLLIFIPIAARPKRLAPKGLQNMIEAVCVYLREEVARPALHEHTDRFISFIWTMFFFILTLNLLAMIPTEAIIHLITKKPNHYGGPATANIWITGALAVTTFFVTHIAGIRQQGIVHYFKTFTPPVPKVIWPFIFVLELITAFVRPFALAMRLFANMVAGHALMATLLGLIIVFKNFWIGGIAVGAIVGISFLELLVAFLQAYIFTLLSTLFISFSISPEH